MFYYYFFFQESSDTADDIDEILSSTLGALYGRATPAAVKQAWEVLNDSYGGDVNRFKSEFLNPVLELLHRVQEVRGENVSRYNPIPQLIPLWAPMKNPETMHQLDPTPPQWLWENEMY